MCALITTEKTAVRAVNLILGRQVAQNNAKEVFSLEEAVALLREAEEDQVATDQTVQKVLSTLGLISR